MTTTLHECDGCAATVVSESLVPPSGWVRRGGRRTDAPEGGRWVLVLCDECAAVAEAA